MSKVIRVVVLCPNGRRETVNLTPNSSILQILEEACQKQNIDPNDFDICHYNKPLDLTLPVRFASLPNNAQLELKPAKNVRKDSLVTIGLQLESGERIMKDFVPSVSMWDVVEQCLSQQSEKNYDEKGELVCIYMRQKLIGEELKSTTLRSLGLTKGSAVIRLLYRNPEDLSDQAHISTPLSSPPNQFVGKSGNTVSKSNEMECDIKQELKTTQGNNIQDKNNHPTTSEELNVPKKFLSVGAQNEVEKLEETSNPKIEKLFDAFSGKGVALGGSEMTNNFHRTYDSTGDKEPMDQSMDVDSNSNAQQSAACEDEIGTIHYIGGRHAVLYSLDDITDMRKADLPDEFFDLTIEDAKYLMEEYRKSRLEMENKPLLTKELRNRQLLKRLGRYKQTVIRIYFPERLVLQAVFEASETIQDVQDFIKEYLEDQSLNLYLYTAPPKEKKDPAKSLIESMLLPAAVVYFGCEKHLPSYLAINLKDKISDPRAATLAAHESRQQAISTEPEDILDDPEMETIERASEEYKVPGPSIPECSSAVQSSGKVPKWLKLSRK